MDGFYLEEYENYLETRKKKVLETRIGEPLCLKVGPILYKNSIFSLFTYPVLHPLWGFHLYRSRHGISKVVSETYSANLPRHTIVPTVKGSGYAPQLQVPVEVRRALDLTKRAPSQWLFGYAESRGVAEALLFIPFKGETDPETGEITSFELHTLTIPNCIKNWKENHGFGTGDASLYAVRRGEFKIWPEPVYITETHKNQLVFSIDKRFIHPCITDLYTGSYGNEKSHPDTDIPRLPLFALFYNDMGAILYVRRRLTGLENGMTPIIPLTNGLHLVNGNSFDWEHEVTAYIEHDYQACNLSYSRCCF